MDDCPSQEDSSMTVVMSPTPTDSTIAFAYIREVKSKKKRFYVLKCQPKPTLDYSDELSSPPPPMPLPSGNSSASPNYLLYAYKSKKYFERGEAKRVYDLANVILLSRCTKKANRTILGVCFQEEVLFLKFDTEDELGRWYFHLSEIFSAKRNCLWPELKQCFGVALKNKDLAAAAARHGKAGLPGQYRFCLTESAVLLVKSDLLNPVLTLPFPCIRSCVHSMTSNFFQIHLGRLSPIGEGVLHFEAEQSSLLKEIIENLLRGLSEASSRDVEFVKARKNRRNSRGSEDYTASSVAAGAAVGGVQRPASMHCCTATQQQQQQQQQMQRGNCCQKCAAIMGANGSIGSLRPASHSSSIVGIGAALAAAAAAAAANDTSGSGGVASGVQRGFSLPPPDSGQLTQQQSEDYCLMDISGGGTGGVRSPNSSMSLSTTTSEFNGVAGLDSDRSLSSSVLTLTQQHQHLTHRPALTVNGQPLPVVAPSTSTTVAISASVPSLRRPLCKNSDAKAIKLNESQYPIPIWRNVYPMVAQLYCPSPSYSC